MLDVRDQLRTSVRSMMRAPGFVLTATVTLALGIGLSTAVFTIADTLLVRRLPVANQDRLVLLWGRTRDGSLPNVPFTLDDIRTIERKFTTLDAVAFFPFRGAISNPIRVQDRVYPLQVALVSGNYFSVLGARPALGRTLRVEDDVAGARPVMVISHRAWIERFGGDSAVVGRSITVVQSGRAHTIVGVMPPGLEYPGQADLWAPLIAYSSAGGFHDLITHELDVLARLRPGASQSDARGELTSYFSRAKMSAFNRNAIGVVRPLAHEVLGDTRPALLIIALASSLLLFISCVNVANLLLIRALGRAKELVVRSALGASRARIVMQSLTESSLLALAGGVLGVAFAIGAVRAFVAIAHNFPRVETIDIDEKTLIAAIVTTVLAMLVSGVAPALFSSRVNANEVLRSGSHTSRSSRVRLVLEGLVIAQVALAVICLTAAGVVTRSFVRLMQADLSFDVRGLVVAPLAIASTELPDPTRTRVALDLAVERLRAMPNVRSVSLAYSPPFIAGGGGIDGTLSARGQRGDKGRVSPVLNLEIVGSGYFETVGVPVLRGRAFTQDDREGSTRVVIVSASVARHFWSGEDPIGKKLVGPAGGDVTVVGVVPETRYRELNSARPSAYFPTRQSFGPALPTTLVIRTANSRATSLPELRRVIEETSPGLAVASITPVEALLDEPRTNARLQTIVLAFFAIAALSLAALGLFAIIATMVRQRTYELGIRMALGASAANIQTLVMRRGMVVTLIGGVSGIAVAFAASRLLSSLVFAIRPSDVSTLVGVVVVMFVVAALASLLPARSSTRIDPVIAMRREA